MRSTDWVSFCGKDRESMTRPIFPTSRGTEPARLCCADPDISLCRLFTLTSINHLQTAQDSLRQMFSRATAIEERALRFQLQGCMNMVISEAMTFPPEPACAPGTAAMRAINVTAFAPMHNPKHNAYSSHERRSLTCGTRRRAICLVVRRADTVAHF